MKRIIIRLITIELKNHPQFYEISDLERRVTVILENCYDLAGSESKVIDSLKFVARMLSYKNKNITSSKNSKRFLLECFEIVVIIKNICLNDDFSFLVKEIIRGLDPEQVETVSFLEYLAITGLHESVSFQYFLNGLVEHVTPECMPVNDDPRYYNTPENGFYHDLEGEFCLLTVSDLSLLAYLETLDSFVTRNTRKW